MKSIIQRVGRKIIINATQSTVFQYKGAQEIYEPYELTVYEDFITVRQGDDEQHGATVVWYSLDSIINIIEYQAEGFSPISLKHLKDDGLGNVLQE
jgi:hypothetical protein